MLLTILKVKAGKILFPSFIMLFWLHIREFSLTWRRMGKGRADLQYSWSPQGASDYTWRCCRNFPGKTPSLQPWVLPSTSLKTSMCARHRMSVNTSNAFTSSGCMPWFSKMISMFCVSFQVKQSNMEDSRARCPGPLPVLAHPFTSTSTVFLTCLCLICLLYIRKMVTGLMS